MIFLSGLGPILVAIFYAFLISIPILIIFLLINTFNKASRIEQVEEELKKLREQVESLQDKYPGGPKK
jgi:hypothetical protein